MVSRIVTHQDLDGIVSAVLCSVALKIDQVVFTGPRQIQDARFPVTESDVVCDLPYPAACGLWFDHHSGNLEALVLRGLDPNQIPGKFALEPSCARVIYSYFKNETVFPDYFEQLVQATDIIDSFQYQSLAQWREQTPGFIIDATIRDTLDNSYYQLLFELLKKQSIHDVVQNSEVLSRYQSYQSREALMLEEIEKQARFLENDTDHELIVLDVTHYNRHPKMVKNLAYLKFPEALGVLAVRCVFKNDIKTNDLHFSMSLSIKGAQQSCPNDVGDIMRTLNLGDGHAGAAAGECSCKSKAEMLKQKEIVLNKIFQLWRQQRHGCL